MRDICNSGEVNPKRKRFATFMKVVIVIELLAAIVFWGSAAAIRKSDLDQARADLREGHLIVSRMQSETGRLCTEIEMHEGEAAKTTIAMSSSTDPYLVGKLDSLRVAHLALAKAKRERRIALLSLGADFVKRLAEAEIEMLEAETRLDRGGTV